MLESLGLSAEAESVYRLMLSNRDWRIEDFADRLGVSQDAIRASLEELADLALVRPSWDEPETLRPVNPQVGLAMLVASAESEIAERQRQIEHTRALIAALAVEHHATRGHDDIVYLNGLDDVRDRLEELAQTAQIECVSFTPGIAQRSDTHQAGKPANQLALERGVIIRSVYQDSFRNDSATLSYVRWLTGLGGQTRSVPILPMMMVIVDQKIALLPIDPADSGAGALETQVPGLVAAVYSLFEQVWSVATPFGAPDPTDENGLSPQEHQLIRILAEGHTDEAAGRRLNLSLRTVRRMMAQITDRLGAQSRFQAGVQAMALGWLDNPATSPRGESPEAAPMTSPPEPEDSGEIRKTSA